MATLADGASSTHPAAPEGASDGHAEATWPARPHLENSRPLNWSRRMADQDASDAIGHLLGLLEQDETRGKARRPADRERLRATMEAMVLDLYAAAKADPERFLAYSRRKADYGEGGPHPAASLTSVTQVVAFLAQAGFVTTRLGSYSRKPNPFGGAEVGNGYLSRIRAEPILIELLEGVFGVGRASITATTDIIGSPLRISLSNGRGAGKTRVAVKLTHEIELMARRVVEGNRLRTLSTLSFDGPEPHGVDFEKIDLYRVFNAKTLDRGGRFFGGWWQSEVPKADRSRILIDGETTVELDYRSLHPRLCHHLQGHPLPLDADPYDVPGWDRATYRDAAKQALSQLIAVGSKDVAPKPRAFKTLFPKGSYAGFVTAVEEASSPIAPWLRAARSLELQYLDSIIADRVLTALTGQGVVCLPNHDSFRVPASAEALLGGIMCEVYRDELGRRSGVDAYPAISGWSSSAMEQQVRSALPPL